MTPSETMTDAVRPFLSPIPLWPRRLLLETPGVEATVPMLRGVWGAALYELDGEVYQRIFNPPQEQVPGYLMRPAPYDPMTAPALDWFLFGSAVTHDVLLRRAWDIASGRGLDKSRRPFVVRRYLDLGPDGRPADRLGPWFLDQAQWPADADAPCRLVFPAPLRLLRQGKLVPEPTLADLTAAAWRRVAAFVSTECQDSWRALQGQLLEAARERPSRWYGQHFDLHRYSGRQHAELELRGVSGVLELPRGVGPLAPLLAAATWLHVGKGTVFGLGEMRVEMLR